MREPLDLPPPPSTGTGHCCMAAPLLVHCLFQFLFPARLMSARHPDRSLLVDGPALDEERPLVSFGQREGGPMTSPTPLARCTGSLGQPVFYRLSTVSNSQYLVSL